MPTPSASVEEFKDRFVRDFVYGSTPDKVLDADITNALNDSTMLFNTGLWIDELERKTAFLFLSAHMLVLNLQEAGGLAAVNTGRGVNSQGSSPISSKSVGSVSISMALPSRITESRILNQFMRTEYGMKYLQLLAPRTVGGAKVVEGWGDVGSGEPAIGE